GCRGGGLRRWPPPGDSRGERQEASVVIEGLLLTLAISIAGGLGAVLRHTVDVAVQVRSADGRSGTFVVNVSGSFVLGLVVGLVPDHPWDDVLGVGLLGGYTTFSTAMLQVVQSFGEQDG